MNSSDKLSVGAILGVFLTLAGLVLRANARTLAWPKEYGYSGVRESTVWAFREGLYADYAQALTLLGCGRLIATFHRWLSTATGSEQRS